MEAPGALHLAAFGDSAASIVFSESANLDQCFFFPLSTNRQKKLIILTPTANMTRPNTTTENPTAATLIASSHIFLSLSVTVPFEPGLSKKTLILQARRARV